MRLFTRFAAIVTGAVLAVAGLSSPALATDVSLGGSAKCLQTGWAASWTLKNNTGQAITVKVVYAGVALTGDLAAGLVLDSGESASTAAVLPSTRKSVTLAVGYVLNGTTVVLSSQTETDDKSSGQSRKHWVKKKIIQCTCPTSAPTTQPTTTPPSTAPTTSPTATAPPTTTPPTTSPAPTASETETEPAGASLPLTGPAGPVIFAGAALLLVVGLFLLLLVRRRRTKFVA